MGDIDTISSPPRGRAVAVLTAGVVALHLAWMVIETLARLDDEWVGLHSEELLNPWMAQMLLAGHWDQWADLRYRAFCGGCGVLGTLAVPLFALFGPTVVVWKAVPLAFHAAVVLGTVHLARRAWGAEAGLLAAALWLGAPAMFLELSSIGWGNHAEVMALVLGAAIVLGDGSSWRRASMAGLVAGFAVWFCRTGALVVPAALLVLVAAGRRGGWKPLVAFAGGLLPNVLLQVGAAASFSRDGEPLGLESLDGALLTAPFALASRVFSVEMVASLWPRITHSGRALPWGYGLGAVAALTALAVLAQRRRRTLSLHDLVPWMLLFGWVLGMLIGHRHWEGLRRAAPSRPFELRHFTPGFVCVTLLLAGAARPSAPRLLRRAVWLLPAVGVGLRAVVAEPPRLDLRGRLITVAGGRDPLFERAALPDLADLWIASAGEPIELRARHASIAAERLFQDWLDALERAAAERGADPATANDLRRAVETRRPPDALERLDGMAGRPPFGASMIAFVGALDDEAVARAFFLALVPRIADLTPASVTTGPMPDVILRLGASLEPERARILDAAVGEVALRRWAGSSTPPAIREAWSGLDAVRSPFRAGGCDLAITDLVHAALLAAPAWDLEPSAARALVPAACWSASGEARLDAEVCAVTGCDGPAAARVRPGSGSAR